MAIVPQNMGNKQNELKLLLQEDKCNLLGIAETWQIDPYDLNMTLKEIKEIEAAEEEKEQLILKMSR